MSDEERKAIKEVNHFKELTRYWQEEEYEEKEIAGYIEIILNLIEKQSKEIEELKEKNEYLPNWVSKKYVSKDKIKAKIEEIDEEIKVKREIAKKPIDRVSGRLLTDSIVELEKVKRVLQSLLEEEE